MKFVYAAIVIAASYLGFVAGRWPVPPPAEKHCCPSNLTTQDAHKALDQHLCPPGTYPASWPAHVVCQCGQPPQADE